MTPEEKKCILQPCYASVLVCGTQSLDECMQHLCKKGLSSFVTGWCDQHHCVSVMYNVADELDFKTPSAYFAHVLTMNQNVIF
jgi:hypothetical protein